MQKCAFGAPDAKNPAENGAWYVSESVGPMEISFGGFLFVK
jgi:hypothetical protein